MRSLSWRLKTMVVLLHLRVAVVSMLRAYQSVDNISFGWALFKAEIFSHLFLFYLFCTVHDNYTFHRVGLLKYDPFALTPLILHPFHPPPPSLSYYFLTVFFFQSVLARSLEVDFGSREVTFKVGDCELVCSFCFCGLATRMATI